MNDKTKSPIFLTVANIIIITSIIQGVVEGLGILIFFIFGYGVIAGFFFLIAFVRQERPKWAYIPSSIPFIGFILLLLFAK